MADNSLKKISKKMARFLRHRPDEIGIELGDKGWVDVKDLIRGMKNQGVDVSLDDIRAVVKNDKKGRYTLSDNAEYIKANQGHSVDVGIDLVEKEPPEKLYHGTSQRNFHQIKKDGLKKMNRHHVHLSSGLIEAYHVGKRHGKPMVLPIMAHEMWKNGYTFYLSDNNVWLTDHVPPDYISWEHVSYWSEMLRN